MKNYSILTWNSYYNITSWDIKEIFIRIIFRFNHPDKNVGFIDDTHTFFKCYINHGKNTCSAANSWLWSKLFKMNIIDANQYLNDHNWYIKVQKIQKLTLLAIIFLTTWKHLGSTTVWFTFSFLLILYTSATGFSWAQYFSSRYILFNC